MTTLLALLLATQSAAAKRAETLEAEGEFLKAAQVWSVLKAKDKAANCLEKAWTSSQDQDALRKTMLAFAAPPADYQKPKNGLQPAGWFTLTEQFGASVDPRFAWTGAKSLKLLPPKGSADGWSSAETLQMPLGASKRVTASAWVFAYDTDAGGKFCVHFDDSAGKRLSVVSIPVVGDQPFWKRYEVTSDVPEGAKLVSLRIDVKIAKGAVWCDEVRLQDGAKDLFMGGGFER